MVLGAPEWFGALAGVRGVTFANDAILPAQWRLSVSEASPERQLAVAVIEQALGDLEKYRAVDLPSAKRIFNSALAWVMSDDEVWPYSFVPLCQALGMSHSAFRSAVTSRFGARKGFSFSEMRSLSQTDTTAMGRRTRRKLGHSHGILRPFIAYDVAVLPYPPPRRRPKQIALPLAPRAA